MNTHAHRGEAGFSFVELLVTIIIAGIAFAAMVPLFVRAQGAQSADRMRNQALSIAQEKIEQVRFVPWSALTTPNLQANGSNVLGLFGTPFTDKDGKKYNLVDDGQGRTFKVQYEVVDKGLTSLVAYKEVRVSVSWDPPPKPVKTVVLKTAVYKQFAGPQITQLSYTPTPSATYDWIGKNEDIGVVTFKAYVNPSQVQQVGSVKIIITNSTGKALTLDAVRQGDTNLWQAAWTTTATTSTGTKYAADGLYTASATAYTPIGAGADETFSPGNTVTQFVRLERFPPGAITDLDAVSGNGAVMLRWDIVSDAKEYWVYRSLTPGGQDAAAVPNPNDPTAWPKAVQSNAYWDTAVANDGVTPYYYRVLAVDANNNHIDLMSTNPQVQERSATPGPQNINFVPTPKINSLTVSVNNVILAWETKLGDGVKWFAVYRNNDLTQPAQVLRATTTTWTDFGREWNTSTPYTVVALDDLLNKSEIADIAPTVPKDGTGTWAMATLPEKPTYELEIRLIGSRINNIKIRVYPLDDNGTPSSPLPDKTTGDTGVVLFAGEERLGFGDYKVVVNPGNQQTVIYARLAGAPGDKVVVYAYL